MFQKVSKDFKPKKESAGCFVEHDGNILLLYRAKHKFEGNKWGLPSGKMDAGESPIETVLRETYEETGIILSPENLSYMGKWYVRYPEHDFIYHIFHTKLAEKLPVKCNFEEHTNSDWVSPRLALELPLVRDLDECIRIVYHTA